MRPAHRSILALLALFTAGPAWAEDWPQFRGPGGLGVSPDTGLPTSWGEGKNIVWQVKLPGAGGSSPIVVGARIFVTCYNGYGLEAKNAGELGNLKRHLVCLDRGGKVMWTSDIVAAVPDYPYKSFQALHGFASATPASDGPRVYAFFGVAGVLAYDLAGKELWRTSVGKGTSDWGSGTSPVLANNLVIVNASVESGSLVALDKDTGKIIWTVKGMAASWNTPLLVNVGARQELVVSVRGKLLAFDPETGKELWSCPGVQDYVCPSVIAHDGVVFAIGGRKNTTIAVKAGGKGAVGPLWTLDRGSNVSSPVYYAGHLYWAHDGKGVAYCVNAANGKLVYEERLQPVPGRIYASATEGAGKVYYVSRESGTYVVAAQPEFKQLAHNTLKSDPSICNASPALADGMIYLRSDRFLYCIGAGRSAAR
jgi:outer membrane protein assembly factor BamB